MHKGINTTCDEGQTLIPTIGGVFDVAQIEGCGSAPIPFDTTQITSPANGSNLKPGDPAPTLAKGGHVPCIAFSGKDNSRDAAWNVSPTLRSMQHDGSHQNGGGQIAIAYPIQERAVSENPDSGPQGKGIQADIAYTLEARNKVQAVAFDFRGRDGGAQFEGPHATANIRSSSGDSSRSYIAEQWAVRRLTPTECERLQGFPDGWTRIPWRNKPSDLCPDGPRYKVLGNSMAVNVMRWLGERIDTVNSILKV